MGKVAEERNRVREDLPAEDRLHMLEDALGAHLEKLLARYEHARDQAAAEPDADSHYACAMRGKAKGVHDAASGLHSIMYRHRLIGEAFREGEPL